MLKGCRRPVPGLCEDRHGRRCQRLPALLASQNQSRVLQGLAPITRRSAAIDRPPGCQHQPVADRSTILPRRGLTIGGQSRTVS
jgi:hypothetical protein